MRRLKLFLATCTALAAAPAFASSTGEGHDFVGDPLIEGGLRVGYTWDDGRYEAALLSRNLLDEIEVVGGVDFNNLTGFTNEPRYLGAEFVVRFD